MEQDPFLQRRQRIDVLHVRRSARHRRHDPRRSPPGVSSTSGSISGVIASHSAGIRFGGTSTVRDARAHGQPPAPPASASRTAPARPRAAPPAASARSPAPPAASARPARRSCRAGPPAPRSSTSAQISASAFSTSPSGASYSAARTHPPPAPAAPCGPASRSASAAAPPAAHTPPAPCTPAAAREQVLAQRLRASTPRRHHVVRHQPLLARHVLARHAPPPRALPACCRSRASISPSSIRKPRIFTWKSIAPQELHRPVRRHRPRSPVRYSRAPRFRRERIGHEPLRRQLRPVQVAARHPAPRRCSSSPGTPTGAGCPSAVAARTARTFASGRPIGCRHDPVRRARRAWRPGWSSSVGP